MENIQPGIKGSAHGRVSPFEVQGTRSPRTPRMKRPLELGKVKRRIIVVSNRLPITISKTEEGGYLYKESSGGLVSGLEGVKKKLGFLWVGWTGLEIPPQHQDKVTDDLKKQHSCVPVFLDQQLAEDHYNGFSNGVLWPLFHYLLEESGKNFDRKLWNSYVKANYCFAEAIAKLYQPGDLIWVHDYHLLVLPKLLREKIGGKVKIGLFLHIPVPSSEVFSVLPVRKSLLQGFLSSDLVGFHTYDYARHFLSSCTRILGLETTPGGVFYQQRFVPVIVLPIGIDIDKFTTQLESPDTRSFYDKYSSNFHNMKVFLGVDRLDYIKGIPHKLRAFERFLGKYPEWRGKVVLLQIAVPSRIDVQEYRHLKAEVEGLVGHINGKYSSLSYHPIHYLFQSVGFAELCGLYALSDALLITSIRDGMNLVAQEYIACQQRHHGVLILSEFAGCSNALSGSLMINPWNLEETADAMYQALSLPSDDRASKHLHLFHYIRNHSAARWGELFIKELDGVSNTMDSLEAVPKLTPTLLSLKLAALSSPSTTPSPSPSTTHGKRIYVLSVEGAFIESSQLAAVTRQHQGGTVPGMITKITEIFQGLSSDSQNLVVVKSGKAPQVLTQWWGHLPVLLIAEHGYYWSFPDTSSPPPDTPGTISCTYGDGKVRYWQVMDIDIDLSWKHKISRVFQHFADRTPGSVYEEKTSCLSWYYDTPSHTFRAQELTSHLDNSFLKPLIVKGDHVIEVRSHEMNNGTVLKKVMSLYPDYQALVYIGDPVILGVDPVLDDSRLITCCIGDKTLKFYLDSSQELFQLFPLPPSTPSTTTKPTTTTTTSAVNPVQPPSMVPSQ